MAREQRTKLTQKDAGEPSVIKSRPETVTKIITGRLIGIASDFVHRKSANGEQDFEGLKGQFRIVPTNDMGIPDPDKPELESGVLFLNDAFHSMISEPLRKARETDDKASINFAFEINVIRAKNPQGYSWSFMPLIESAGNPLDALVAQLPPPGKVASLEDKRKQRA